MKLRRARLAALKNLPSSKPRKFEKGLAKVAKKINGRLAVVKDKLPVVAEEKSLALNSSGNKRGLHNRKNPPDGEKMKKIRAMRNFYSKAMPKPQCNTCAFSTNCPQFKPDYECAFLPFLNSHKVESVSDLMNYMKDLCATNIQRLHLATIFERMGGGMPSTELSESYAMMMDQMAKLVELQRETPAEVQEAGKDSIISKLFGSINILINTTGSHKKEIAESLTEIPVEDGQTTQQAQLALTTGKTMRSVNSELLAEFEASKLQADPAKESKKPVSTIKVDTLT